jgi:hypothetical protein
LRRQFSFPFVTFHIEKTEITIKKKREKQKKKKKNKNKKKKQKQKQEERKVIHRRRKGVEYVVS